MCDMLSFGANLPLLPATFIPSNYQQNTGRCHRMSQNNAGCFRPVSVITAPAASSSPDQDGANHAAHEIDRSAILVRSLMCQQRTSNSQLNDRQFPDTSVIIYTVSQ